MSQISRLSGNWRNTGFFRRVLCGLPVLGVLALMVTSAGGARAQTLLDLSLGGVERKLAVLDPGGRYLTRPLMRRVPKLSVKGTYYFSSGVLFQKNDGAGFREKDFRLLQAENLVEAEFNYLISPGLEITSINQFLYDAAYDIESSRGMFGDDVNSAFQLYDDFDRVARELYISYRTPKLDVVIGKQQVAWGKMDGRFIDVINPIDGRESVQLESSDYERRRLPLWMANATYYFGGTSFNVLWIPDFRKDLNPTYGTPWFSPLIPPTDQMARGNEALLSGRTNLSGDNILTQHEPDWTDIEDHQFAARLDSSIGKLTWGAIYFYAWERNSSQEVVGRFMAGGGPRLTVQPRHERVHHFGVTSDYAWVIPSVPMLGDLPTVFRMEALYTVGVQFTDYNRLASARAGTLNNGLSQRNTLRAAVALEFALPNNTTAILQPSFYLTTNWDHGLGGGFGGAYGDKWALAPVLFVERPIRATRDRLKFSATITPYISWPDRGFQGVKTKFITSYELSQYIKADVTYTAYSGGDKVDLFGQYGDWDNIGIELLYEF